MLIRKAKGNWSAQWTPSKIVEDMDLEVFLQVSHVQDHVEICGNQGTTRLYFLNHDKQKPHCLRVC